MKRTTITSRINQLNIELQEIELELEKYRQILYEAPDAIAITDLSHKILYVNPAWEKLNEYSFEEVYGKTPNFLPANKNSRQIFKTMYQYLERGKSYSSNKLVYKTKNGQNYFAQVTTFPIRKDSKNLFYVRITRNITELVDLLNKSRSLAHFNRLILSSAGEGIYGLDTKGNATFINPAAAQLVGYSVEELLGKNLHTVFHHSTSGGKKIPTSKCPNYVRTLKQGKPFHSSDYVFWKKDGTPISVEITSTPIIENGQVSGAVVIFTDITERKQADYLKTEFLSIVSHELKTPITTVSLIAESLVRKEKNIKNVKMLSTINRELKRLTSLINDLLDVSRLDTQKFQITAESLYLPEYIGQIVENMQMITNSHKILVLTIPKISVVGDSHRLEQVFINLISNAARYSPAKTDIIISAEIEKDHVIISVKDHGCGIKPSDRTKIFDKYYQVKHEKTHGGFGLGLYITQEIIKKHRGKIWVESEISKGSTFYFTLPIID